MRAAVMKLSRTVDGGGAIVDGWEDRSEMGEPVTCNLEPATFLAERREASIMT